MGGARPAEVCLPRPSLPDAPLLSPHRAAPACSLQPAAGWLGAGVGPLGEAPLAGAAGEAAPEDVALWDPNNPLCPGATRANGKVPPGTRASRLSLPPCPP